MRHLTNLIHVLIFLFSPFPLLLLHTNRYIYKLAGLHESDGNFAEAGLTLMLHAKTLEVREGERERETGRECEQERERLFINIYFIYFSGHWILSQLLRASIQFTLQEKGKRYYTLKQSDYWIKER